jgi:autotransporter-associated beta strand protein/T5SS/PEP-CTERM-associated repeat protein
MKLLTAKLSVAALLLGVCSSQAQLEQWVGGSNNWFTASNWNPANVPSSANNVQVDTDMNNPAVIKSAGAAARSLSVGTNFGDNGVLRVNQTGTLDVSPNAAFIIGNGGTGTVVLQDTSSTTAEQNLIIGSQSGSVGDLTVRDNAGLTVDGQLRVGDSGQGSLTSSGTNTTGFISVGHMDVGTFNGGVGTVDLSNAGTIANLTVSGVSNVGTSGTGTLTLHDGGYMYTDGLSIGTNSDGNGTVIVRGELASGAFVSTINVQNGNNIDVGAGGTGDLELRNGGAASAENIHIGRDADSVGTLLVQGLSNVTSTPSTLTANNDLSVGGTQGGPGGQGLLQITNNGVVNVANNMWVWGSGTGTGGTLAIDNSATFTVGGTLDFDGGVLHFIGGGVTFANNVFFGNTQSPDGMTAQVDSAKATMTGVLSGPGGLTKIGAGNLVLQGSVDNTYTGTTTVEEGMLTLNAISGTTMIPGDLVIGLGSGGPNSAVVLLNASSQIADTSNVTINSDGQFDMNSMGESIHNLVINQGNVVNVPADGITTLGLNGTLDMTGGSITGGTGATPGLLLIGNNSDVTATSDAAGNAAVIASNITLNFVGTFTRTFTVNDGPGSIDLSITGIIQDSTGAPTGAGLIKEGAGTLEFASATGNTYTGTTHVNDGVLSLTGPSDTDQVPDNLVIGDGNGGSNSAVVILQNESQIANGANVTIKRDGLFDMNSFGETINNLIINRGNVVNVPTNGLNSLALFGTLDMTGGSITGGLGATPGLFLAGANSDVTATSDAAGNAALIASNVSLGGITRTFTVNDGPGAVDLDVTGVVQDATAGLTKEGDGLMRLAGDNTYAGDTTVNAGELRVDGSIVSAQTLVNSGGTLSGIGILGGNLINNGTVSPGDSPGTLTVNGNYTQNASGTLVIEITSLATHDLLQMGGAANLDGTLQIVKLSNFAVLAGDKIIFLTAANGVNGEFATVISDFGSTGTLIMPEVIYEPNDVALLFAQGSFVIGGLTPNQTAVAANLNNSVGDPRADALINFLDTEQLANLPHDYDLIAPEELAALYEISFSQAVVRNINLQHRMDDIRAGSTGFSGNGFNMTTTSASNDDPGLSYGLEGGKVVLPSAKDKDVVMLPTPENRWGVFATGSGDFVNVGDDDHNAHGYDITSGNVLVGVDYRAGDHFAIGLDGSYSSGTANLVDHGWIDVDGGQAGAYATVYGFKIFGSLVHFDAGVDGGWNSYDTRRTGLQGLPVRGSTNGSEFNAFVAYGGDWYFGHLDVGTWSSLQYTDVNVDSFTETGSLAPLHFPDQDEDSIRGSTGVRLAYDFKGGRTIFRPEVRAAWQHEYGDQAYPIDARFASGAGGIFTVHGPSIGRDSALVDGGMSILWSNRVSTYIFYDGVLGRSNYDNNAVSGGFRFAF